MDHDDDCLLYAELLANIRQISLAASLPSPCDASTQAALEADCQAVELKHAGRTHRLTLPARVSVGATLLPIQDKQKGSKNLSWRLPVDAKSISPTGQSDHAPWSATDLKPGSWVACGPCRAIVVPSGAVKAWKDLPSENWAEMMEFWHCHKPDHKHGEDHSGEPGKADEKTLAARGYGASSAISAQEGVGFVDLTTLLFAEADCQNLTFSSSSYEQGSSLERALRSVDTTTNQTRTLNVFCSACRSQLGWFNIRTAAVTLPKWEISCESYSGVVPIASECLAATLIATISRSGASKSLITPMPGTIPPYGETRRAIHIWVLNSNIVFSSRGPKARPAIKLLYRQITPDEADKMLEAVTCDAQEINLPAEAIREVLHFLEESNTLLPPTERRFKEWEVGLLMKWKPSV